MNIDGQFILEDRTTSCAYLTALLVDSNDGHDGADILQLDECGLPYNACIDPLALLVVGHEDGYLREGACEDHFFLLLNELILEKAVLSFDLLNRIFKCLFDSCTQCAN